MTYTILSAQWGNDEHTCAIVLSEEVGHVAVSERDTPDAWSAFVQWRSYGHLVEAAEVFLPAPPPKKTTPIAELEARLARLEARAQVSSSTP